MKPPSSMCMYCKPWHPGENQSSCDFWMYMASKYGVLKVLTHDPSLYYLVNLTTRTHIRVGGPLASERQYCSGHFREQLTEWRVLTQLGESNTCCGGVFGRLILLGGFHFSHDLWHSLWNHYIDLFRPYILIYLLVKVRKKQKMACCIRSVITSVGDSKHPWSSSAKGVGRQFFPSKILVICSFGVWISPLQGFQGAENIGDQQ